MFAKIQPANSPPIAAETVSTAPQGVIRHDDCPFSMLEQSYVSELERSVAEQAEEGAVLKIVHPI
jgi:hypothetical protein